MFIWGEEGMKGVDSWRWVHGERRGYSYHGEKAEEWGRSCDRVDLGVVSRGLIGEGNGELKRTQMRLAGADIWGVLKRGGPVTTYLSLWFLISAMDESTWTMPSIGEAGSAWFMPFNMEPLDFVYNTDYRNDDFFG